MVICSMAFTIAMYLFKVIYLITKPRDVTVARRQLEVNEAIGRRKQVDYVQPGRFSGWLSVFLSLSVSLAFVLIKYGPLYPVSFRGNSVRVIPRSMIGIGELDQVVAILGGIITLLLSLYEVLKVGRGIQNS
ncbi:hypothetical protein QBC38DRAFT_461700 [Podospora fimiseda]|uniref:Uncharacterized protein n=1 Tax=Podospora fimiseda TaxID=252190 RepID=A0AAN6YMR0_9PEZI|nr:hypothetical protein QBC38DRAFT_461700 [Podospora fimiseda]